MIQDPLDWGPLSLEDFVRYAGASGDFNPLHYDRAAAERAGLPDVIAQGMLLSGLLASSLETWFGPGSVRDLSVRFRRPAYVGDVLTAHIREDTADGVLVALSRGAEDIVTGMAKLEMST